MGSPHAADMQHGAAAASEPSKFARKVQTRRLGQGMGEGKRWKSEIMLMVQLRRCVQPHCQGSPGMGCWVPGLGPWHCPEGALLGDPGAVLAPLPGDPRTALRGLPGDPGTTPGTPAEP